MTHEQRSAPKSAPPTRTVTLPDGSTWCGPQADHRARCLDCRVDTIEADEYYRVRDDVWRGAAPEDAPTIAIFLCIGCLEARIGRRLVPADFVDVPVNRPPGLFSARLLDRLDVQVSDYIVRGGPNDGRRMRVERWPHGERWMSESKLVFPDGLRAYVVDHEAKTITHIGETS